MNPPALKPTIYAIITLGVFLGGYKAGSLSGDAEVSALKEKAAQKQKEAAVKLSQEVLENDLLKSKYQAETARHLDHIAAISNSTLLLGCNSPQPCVPTMVKPTPPEAANRPDKPDKPTGYYLKALRESYQHSRKRPRRSRKKRLFYYLRRYWQMNLVKRSSQSRRRTIWLLLVSSLLLQGCNSPQPCVPTMVKPTPPEAANRPDKPDKPTGYYLRPIKSCWNCHRSRGRAYQLPRG